ncbi:uncharacterized protein LOC110250617 [Exaiptasia diaphana]|uniref:Uncharacterized protein n=1 Tax=Exaiptasia diaphana TaxID=2652724 RepID=A0A913Y143_EXADI|nr:uncharacterized protein LOC110250617 [Exaiptasia diaphana]
MLNKQNIKKTWKLTGMLVGRSTKHHSCISKVIYNNKCYTDEKDICNKLNEHFINVGPSLAQQLPLTRDDPTKFIKHLSPESFIFRGICDEEVSDLISNLNSNKACIGTPAKCIKLANPHISSALASVFNLSLLQGIVKDILKISKITPIDKGGEIFDPTNYRPISTLTLAKFLKN